MGFLVLSLAASPAWAQRPSFGGLFEQVQDMLAGDEPFQAVAFGDGRCSIGVDPTGALTGLIEYDPIGFRLMGDGTGNGMRLLFGPSFDCAIEVSPVVPGLLLRDPIVRILPPPFDPPIPPILSFGETDECRILADPTRGGLIFEDPNGFRFVNIRGLPEVQIPGGFIRFGETCTVGVDPDFRGVILTDPDGFRILGLDNGTGGVLTFGPTDDCRIFIDPNLRPNAGLIFTDPVQFTFESPKGPGEATMAVSGIVMATQFVQESSRRLKENIRPIDNALETVKKLRGVRFDWKKEARASGGSDLGFVAEEVAEVVSEAAVYDEENKATGINYANIVALAVESIKAQQEQIEAQQKLIAELQKEVAALRSSE